jgi:hypothetical protein
MGWALAFHPLKSPIRITSLALAVLSGKITLRLVGFRFGFVFAIQPSCSKSIRKPYFLGAASQDRSMGQQCPMT